MSRWHRSIIYLTLLLLLGSASYGEPSYVTNVYAPPSYDGQVSVLTYNIRGLPWPFALGRPSAIARIAGHLRAMRAAAAAPTVVVLQEAFTPEARALLRTAGYRYFVRGPRVRDPGAEEAGRNDTTFAGAARWWRGETQGKVLGSGLVVLSDYPIVGMRRVAFPQVACAGFDCLANKGALLVTVTIPGAPTPIDIVTTHLNSRGASWADDSRSIYAYRHQIAVLSRFIRDNHDPDRPLIVAGDFNVGSAGPRRAALIEAASRDWGAAGPAASAYDSFARAGGTLDDDARYSREHAKDWQFYLSGTRAGLVLRAIDVPFGGSRQGTMLSDHVGYVARFQVIAPGTKVAAGMAASHGAASV